MREEGLFLATPAIIQLQHRHEGLLRHIHLTHGLHSLLTLGLLLQQFLLAGDITAIALGQHILSLIHI